MNSLLSRQIRKHLSKDVSELDPEFQSFLKVISNSFDNFDNQIKISQRAMVLSSEELSLKNKKLKDKAIRQKGIIKSLNELLNDKDIHDLDVESISIIENQAERIKQIHKDLELKNKDLQDYARGVSHDLKSPLRNIYSLVSWLIDDLDFTISKENTTTINLIYENLERMENLINGILSYSTLGSSLIKEEPIDLNILVNEIIKSLKIPSSIEVVILKKLPVYQVDRYRMVQLFQNLISNAIKYNDKEIGRIFIDYNSNKEYHQFSITDNGIGIEKSQLNKIFTMFYKIENRTDSTGIGLNIVKRIVNYYNGEIWVESVYKKGTTFYFTLKK